MRHLKYGGSTMERTLACPAWATLAAQMPKAPSSDFADEGNLLHQAMENWAKYDMQPRVGDTYGTAIMTEELIETKFKPACEALDKLLDDYDAEVIFVEPFVELIPDQAGGSIDCLAVSTDGKAMFVIDYKFGHNTVAVENNAQLMFYALCAAVDPLTATAVEKAETLHLCIIQPNADGEVLDIAISSIDVLDAFELEVYTAIDKSEKGGLDPVQGKHCRYCPAQATCPAKTGLLERAQELDPAIASNLSEALAIIPDIQHWIKAVEKLAHESLENGNAIEGFKLVQKRPRRVWTDEEKVMEFLRKKRKIHVADTVTTKLKTPAQIEKLFSEKGIDPDQVGDYIVSVSSGTTVVPESDKRPDASTHAGLARLAQRT